MKARKITICIACVYFTLITVWILTLIAIKYWGLLKVVEAGFLYNILALSLTLFVFFLPLITSFLIVTSKEKSL